MTHSHPREQMLGLGIRVGRPHVAGKGLRVDGGRRAVGSGWEEHKGGLDSRVREGGECTAPHEGLIQCLVSRRLGDDVAPGGAVLKGIRHLIVV